MSLGLLLYVSMFAMVSGIFIYSAMPGAMSILMFETGPLPIFLILGGFVIAAIVLLCIRGMGMYMNEINEKLLTVVVKSTAILGFLSTVAMCVIQFYLRSSYVVGDFFATSGALGELLKGSFEAECEAARLIFIDLALALIAGLPFFILCYAGGDFSSYVTVYSKTGYDGGSFESHRSDEHLHVFQFVLIGAVIIIPLVALSATPIIYFVPAAYSVFILFPYGKRVFIPVASVLAVAAIILTVFSLRFDPDAPPSRATEGLAYELSENGEAYSVVGYEGEDVKVFIPDSYNGIPVTEIGDSAFLENSSITEIYIPKTLKRIGASAFKLCTTLSLVEFRDESSLTVIDAEAFSKCEFTSFTLPSSVEEIGDSSFRFCAKLQTFEIQESSKLNSIGNHAFSGCEDLAEFYFPEGLESIGENGFYGCDQLSSISIPDSVTTIGKSAFELCENLREATIGNGVTALDRTFSWCKFLETVTLGTGINSLYHVFGGCYELEEIILPVTEGWVNRYGAAIPSKYLSDPEAAVDYLDDEAYRTEP